MSPCDAVIADLGLHRMVVSICPSPPLKSLMTELPSVRAVVFDLDGLMFNTEELYQQVGSELLRRRAKTFDVELLDQMMGRPPRIALQMMIDWHALDDTVAQLSAETEEIFPEIL